LDVSRYCDPPLTTVAQPAEKIGERSADLLFQLLEEQQPSQTEYVLPVEFIIRQSTAAPRT
jgi:LacI family transcriptional regulator, repressor for deo operon, udp, cdd, tsx, nupC, and nupG